jgi:hypothetical protein
LQEAESSSFDQSLRRFEVDLSMLTARVKSFVFRFRTYSNPTRSAGFKITAKHAGSAIQALLIIGDSYRQGFLLTGKSFTSKK